MTTARQEAAYSRRLTAAVARALASGATSIGDLAASAPGAWPAQFQALAPHLAASAPLPVSDVVLPADPWPSLPVPHPADGEWRFTAAVAEKLAASLMGYTDSDTPPVLIGIPSVFVAMERHGLPSRLFERSRATARELVAVARLGEVTATDVTRAVLPLEIARATLVDPPWYPSVMRSFLWAASHMTAPGGTVIACVPPILVRPSAADERRALFRRLSAYRLQLVDIQRSGVRYATPPFEHFALHAAGVREELPEWRVGDLLVARRLPGGVGRRPAPPSADRWTIVGDHTERVAFRDVWGNEDPRLTPLVPGDILPSVSARDPRLPRVRVWTARNEVFGCGDPTLAAAISRAITQGVDPARAMSDVLGRTLGTEDRRRLLIVCRQLEGLGLRDRRHESASTLRSMPIGSS